MAAISDSDSDSELEQAKRKQIKNESCKKDNVQKVISVIIDSDSEPEQAKNIKIKNESRKKDNVRKVNRPSALAQKIEEFRRKS